MATLKELGEQLRDVKQQRTELSRQDAELKQKQDELEQAILVAMDTAGLKRCAIDGVGTLTSTTKIVPNVEDWDAFYRYVIDNEAMYLLQRRISQTAFAEHVQNLGDLPGIKPVELASLSMRKN